MIFEIFLIGVIFGAICLYLGYSQQSFPFAYLGMFVFLVIGLFLLQEGLSTQTGADVTTSGTTKNIVNTYTTYTTDNNSIVNILAYTFFFIPLAGVLLSTLFALRGWRSGYR